LVLPVIIQIAHIRDETALSGDARIVRLSHYLPTLPQTGPIAIFVGAMARGSDDFADGVVDEKISISNYPLSASVACGKVRVY
jgi:rRNA small subunit pseudouridine methyltransferase Nep1